MSVYSEQLPEPVLNRAMAMGVDGRNWLAELDRLVEDLENRWHIRFGRILSGGSESLVAEVLTNDGSAAVVKIGLPGSADLRIETQVFQIADGRGYAQALAYHDESNAMLMEKLGKPLATEGKSVDDQIVIVCEALTRAWRPLNNASGFITGAEKCRWLAGFVRSHNDLLGQPLSESVITTAIGFAAEREAAFDPDSSYLIHGDAHPYNLLKDGNSGYKYIDPDGLFAERACDLAVPMRDWCEELLEGDTATLARRRCELLAELTGVDELAIWQWGYVERVSTGLVLKQIGMMAEATAYFDVSTNLVNEKF